MNSAVYPHYPVIIAGASYAGLAAASVLGERALLIDQHRVGAIQHSACAIPVPMIEHFKAQDAVLQTYPEAIVHTRYGDTTFDLPTPYCIFDHETLCESVFERAGSDFLHARIQSFDGRVVSTSAGNVSGDIFIDASGWKGALVTNLEPDLHDVERVSVGIEADVEGRDDGIHFYTSSAFPRGGYAWVFPAADTLRIGILSYAPQSELKASLSEFLADLGLEAKPCRGGMIPWFSRPGVVDNVMLAGDAAGHCLPVTAEGIRFALSFGELAGDTARRIVDGETARHQGLRHYAASTRKHQRKVTMMRGIQRLMTRSPEVLTHAWVRSLSAPLIRNQFLRAYGNINV
jgi:menaquinone-9 beta-reductase